MRSRPDQTHDLSWKLWGAALCLLLSLTLAIRGAAQDESEQDRQFATGLALYEDGEHLEAAKVWEELLVDMGPDRGWKLNYNLGLAYHAASNMTLAVERFNAFTARVAAEVEALPPTVEQRREDAAAKVKAIELSYGAVVFNSSAAAVTVSIDGGPPRRAGFTAYLPPGAHNIIIAKGTATRTASIDVKAARRVIVDTSDPTPPTPTPDPPPVRVPPIPTALPTTTVAPPLPPPAFPTLWVAVGGGATALSFILPGVLGASAAAERNEATALGPGHTAYPTARDEFLDARSAYELSYILPAALGAVTATIAIVGLVQISSHDPYDVAIRF